MIIISISEFGDKVIDEVAASIAEANPGVKGFNCRGLYRIKQFFETYKNAKIVTSLVTQSSCIHTTKNECITCVEKWKQAMKRGNEQPGQNAWLFFS